MPVSARTARGTGPRGRMRCSSVVTRGAARIEQHRADLDRLGRPRPPRRPVVSKSTTATGPISASHGAERVGVEAELGRGVLATRPATSR